MRSGETNALKGIRAEILLLRDAISSLLDRVDDLIEQSEEGTRPQLPAVERKGLPQVEPVDARPRRLVAPAVTPVPEEESEVLDDTRYEKPILAGFLVFAGLLMLLGLVAPGHKDYFILGLVVCAMAFLLVAASLWGRRKGKRHTKA